MSTVSKDFQQLIEQSLKSDFHPFAFFDRKGNHLQVEIRDCSTCERWVNECLTIICDNHPEANQVLIIGLRIQFIKYLLGTWGIAMEGRYPVTEILERVMSEFTLDDTVRSQLESLMFITSNIELTVDFDAKE